MFATKKSLQHGLVLLSPILVTAKYIMSIESGSSAYNVPMAVLSSDLWNYHENHKGSLLKIDRS